MATGRAYRGSDHDGDFTAVRDLLHRIDQDGTSAPHFGWVRWEWAFALECLDRPSLHRIGVWEDDGQVVGVATYEDRLGDAFLLVDPAHRRLLPAMLDHALDRLRGPQGVRVLIDDSDAELQHLARGRGLVATQAGDRVAVLDLAGDLGYEVPAGYRVSSLADGVDLEQLDRLMHRGFHHSGEHAVTAEGLAWRERSISAPSGDRALSIVVEADDGTYAGYCGAWYREGHSTAFVEPVCADPDHRRRGCARAAVLEAMTRCAARGAQRALVGSDQQFYYALGFAPRYSATWWAPALP